MKAIRKEALSMWRLNGYLVTIVLMLGSLWIGNLCGQSLAVGVLSPEAAGESGDCDDYVLKQARLGAEPRQAILVVYAVSSKGQSLPHTKFMLSNLEFFLNYGGVSHCEHHDITYRITLSGQQPQVVELIRKHQKPVRPGGVPRVHFLQRKNHGYDFGSHRATLDAEAARLRIHLTDLPYDAYIFLNDGTRGPFYPTYMPKGWHWVDGFIRKLQPPVALVGTSVVCLHESDFAVRHYPYMIGPKVEGFAFSMTGAALVNDILHGTSFHAHKDKIAAIVSGEYNLTANVFRAKGRDWTITSLLSSQTHINFRNPSSWACNNYAHPSRPGTHGPGISISPFEVIFHKAIWYSIHGGERVSWVEMEAYTSWRTGATIPMMYTCQNDGDIVCHMDQQQEQKMYLDMYSPPPLLPPPSKVQHS